MARNYGKNHSTTRARETHDGERVNKRASFTVRTEGQRRLLEIVDSLAVIAEKCGVGKTVVSYWRSGAKLPGPSPRRSLSDVYGIDPSDWEREPALARSESQAARSTPEPSAPRIGKPTTLEEVEDQLRMLRDLQYDDGLVPSERVRLADSVGKLLAIKARLERDQELLEDRVIREHPFWRRIKEAILDATKPFPDAARAIADGLGRLEA